MKRFSFFLVFALVVTLIVPSAPKKTFAEGNPKFTVKQFKKNPNLFSEVVKEQAEKEKKLFQKDTDGDGLTDGFENTIIKNGIVKGIKLEDAKADEDLDQDGLTNKEEQKYGTNPLDPDTDGDGISDGDEVKKYKTNPTLQDTDKDGLSDSFEIEKTKTNPNKSDSDGDGIKDGDVVREFQIPKNPLGISGTAFGKGEVSERFSVRHSPLLIVQALDAVKTFDIQSTDSTITFNLEIPVTENNLKLYRYHYQEEKLGDQKTGLEVVENQKFDPKTQTIHAKVKGGDSFAVLPAKAYQSSTASGESSPFKPFQGKAKVLGMPGVTIDGNSVNDKGQFTLKKKAGSDVKKVSGQEVLQSKYQITGMQTVDGKTFVTAEAVTTQSGRAPIILVHGFGGDMNSYGFNNRWDNHEDVSNAIAESAVSPEDTFSGQSYKTGDPLPYYHPDANKIQQADRVSDETEVGPGLMAAGYTPNEDLFGFEYWTSFTDGYEWIQAESLFLNEYVKGLHSIGKLNQRVNLVAHSMGGLVSRYYIENYDFQDDGVYDVNKLVTLGTPHYGSDSMNWNPNSQMNRFYSGLWNATDFERYCFPLSNQHPQTNYYAFGGFKHIPPGQDTLVKVGHLNDIGASSYDQDVRNRYLVPEVLPSDIDDGTFGVNIDSALGSDRDPDYNGNLPTLDMADRIYIFHSTYGDHVEMTNYSRVHDMVYNIINGLPY